VNVPEEVLHATGMSPSVHECHAHEMVQEDLADGRHGASEMVGRHSCVNVTRDWEKRQNAFFSQPHFTKKVAEK